MAIMEGKGRGESTEARSKCGIVHLLLTFSTGGKKVRQWEFAPDVYACKSETFIFEIAKRDKTREREREREKGGKGDTWLTCLSSPRFRRNFYLMTTKPRKGRKRERESAGTAGD